MKKVIMTVSAVLALMLALTCFAGCSQLLGSKPIELKPSSGEEAEPSATDMPDESDEPDEPSTGNVLPDEAKAELIDILKSILYDYSRGTAGSSLVAVRIVVELVKWYIALEDADKAAIKGTVEEFFASLDTEAAAEFTENLKDIFGNALYLTGEHAEDLLESAGESMEGLLPAIKESITDLFSAIFDGIGEIMPE